MIILGESITRDFTTENPLTGQVQDADVIPTCEIFEDTTDIAIITPAVVKRVGHAGVYRVSFTTSIALGFELGKFYNVIVTATVAGISAKGRISSFHIEQPLSASGGTLPI
jgi:hypothetical protein